MIDLLADPLTVAPQLLGSLVTAHGVTIRLTEVEAYCGESDPASHAFKGRTPRNNTMFLGPGHLYVYFTYGMHYCMNVVCWPDGRAGGCLIRAGEVVDGEELARERRPGVVRSRDLARGPANLTKTLGITKDADGSLLRVDGSVVASSHASDCVVEPLRGQATSLSSAVRVDSHASDCVVEPLRGQATSLSSAVRAGSHASDCVVVDLTTRDESAEEAGFRVATGPRVGVSGIGGDGVVYPWRYWIEGDPTVSAYKRGGGSRTRRGQSAAVAARELRLNPE